MYEANGWCGLAETPQDIDAGSLHTGINELRERLRAVAIWKALIIDLRHINGIWFLSMTCFTNRRRGEADYLDDLFGWVAERFHGSWGLIYDRDDEMPEPYGNNRFRVRVIARGAINQFDDPFLSPVRPVIED